MNKFLMIGPAWVGDMVMSQTLYRVLKAQFPDISIDVLAPDWTRALLQRMPEVNQALSMPIGHGQFKLKERWAIARKLKSQGYTHAFVLPNSWKSALIPFLAGIPKRTGWRGEMRYGLLNDVRLLDKEKYPLMIERFMALGMPANAALEKPYPLPVLKIDSDSLAQSLKKHGLNTDKPILAMCPGAEFGPSKRWPANYFAEVAKHQLKAGYQVWLFGSKNDMPIAKDIQTITEDGCVDLIGKTNLDEAIDLLSLAKKVISNDSGLMHIAAALEKPLVTIYGSTSTDFTPPLGDQVKVLNLHLPCSPCFKRECPLGHWKCMKDLTPEMAIDALSL